MQYPGKELKEGDSGPAVLAVQKALGFGPGGQTARFGPYTEQCVVQFQKTQGLAADGIVGPATWAALFRPQPATTADLGLLALDYAKQALRAGVREKPRGSNRGPEVDIYLREAGVPESIIANGLGFWCMAFVNHEVAKAARTLGIKNPITGAARASCSAMYALAKRQGRLTTRPEPGDLFLCIGGPRGHYHVGFVAGPVDAHGRFDTIEGNSNDDGSANGVEVAFRPRGRRLSANHYVRL